MGQVYDFDHVTSYSIDYGNGKFEHVTFVNSANQAYSMRFLKYPVKPGVLTVGIRDHMRGETHYFEAIENGGDQIHDFHFRYAKTIVFKNADYYRRSRNYSHEIEFGSDSLTIKLRLYKKRRRKNPDITANLTLSRFDRNLFPAVKYTMMDGMLSRLHLDYPFNAVLESGDYVTNGNHFRYKKVFVKPISLRIIAPAAKRYVNHINQ